MQTMFLSSINGAKKYCYIKEKSNKKINFEKENVIEKGKEKSKVLEITVAGVPKEGAKELKDITDFKDDLVFHFENTNKQLLFYIEGQHPIVMTDYQGNKMLVTDISGCGLFPTSYVLGKALDYCELLTDNSSTRARYMEEINE